MVYRRNYHYFLLFLLLPIHDISTMLHRILHDTKVMPTLRYCLLILVSSSSIINCISLSSSYKRLSIITLGHNVPLPTIDSNIIRAPSTVMGLFDRVNNDRLLLICNDSASALAPITVIPHPSAISLKSLLLPRGPEIAAIPSSPILFPDNERISRVQLVLISSAM